MNELTDILESVSEKKKSNKVNAFFNPTSKFKKRNEKFVELFDFDKTQKDSILKKDIIDKKITVKNGIIEYEKPSFEKNKISEILLLVLSEVNNKVSSSTLGSTINKGKGSVCSYDSLDLSEIINKDSFEILEEVEKSVSYILKLVKEKNSLITEKLEKEVLDLLIKATKNNETHIEKNLFPSYDRKLHTNPVLYLEKYVGKYLNRYNGGKGDFFYSDDLLKVFGLKYKKTLDTYLRRSGLKYRDYVPNKKLRKINSMTSIIESNGKTSDKIVNEVELQPLLKNLSIALSKDNINEDSKFCLHQARKEIDDFLLSNDNSQEVLDDEELESEIIDILNEAIQFKSENKNNINNKNYIEKKVFPDYDRQLHQDPVLYLEKYVGKYLNRYNGGKGDFFYSDDLLVIFGLKYSKTLDTYLRRSGLKYRDYVPNKKLRKINSMTSIIESNGKTSDKIDKLHELLKR